MAVVTCITCFPLLHLWRKGFCWAFRFLFIPALPDSEHIHTWELATASKWTGPCLLAGVYECVLIGWLYSRGVGCRVRFREAAKTRRTLESPSPSPSVHINSVSDYSPADIQYFCQLREDLVQHMSFVLICPLLCPPFLFLVLSCLCTFSSSCLSPPLFPGSSLSRFILD